MSDSVTIRCATCGNTIGDITFVPGSQTLGCEVCHGITWVTITHDGEVNTGAKFWGTIPKKVDDDD